ncbi:MAG: hypothetical protein A3J52_02035 [Omnitrophica bacterium RIFCSPHIGHO2_02_FULL_49_9]|nr:MAG: hypothetical protein A3J52_02035 [Omnitrophica bacterium RIFCSPHIGHO2_02_FULL_49_9]
MSFDLKFIRFYVLASLLLIVLPGKALWADAATPVSEALSELPQGTSPAASTVSLEALIESVRQHNPELIAAKAEWIAKKKRVWIDSALPDPMAGYDVMGEMTETRVGPQESRFMFSQDIPFPLKLYEKGKAAGKEAQAAYQKYLATERDLVNDLRKFYYELYYLDASIEVIEGIRDLLKKFEGVASTRYANLAGSQRDVAKAQAEVSMSLEKLFELRQRRETAAAMINAILDRDPMTEVGKAKLPPMPVLNRSLIELVNVAVENRQEIKEMEAVVSGSKHKKRIAQLAYLPDINVGFEYTAVGSGMTTSDEDGKDSWMFPLRINIPLWQNRIIPEIQEAQKQVEANQARLRAAKNTTFYEVKDAYYRFDSASKIEELYETAVIPQAEIALSSDQAGYEGSKTDFLNLLDSERVLLNARLAQIRFYTEALKSHADLVRSTGLDLGEFEMSESEEKDHDA